MLPTLNAIRAQSQDVAIICGGFTAGYFGSNLLKEMDEVSRKYILYLFRALQAAPHLVKQFVLNYGAWQLFDHEFLELYQSVFVVSPQERPVFEMSPEIFDHSHRDAVKQHAPYSISDLKENIQWVNRELQERVLMRVFFSRYHTSDQSAVSLKNELTHINRFKHSMTI
jgi:hypothetical protein